MLRNRTIWVVVLILLAGSLAAQTKGDAAKAKPSGHAEAHTTVNIWPQIPFVRGKD